MYGKDPSLSVQQGKLCACEIQNPSFILRFFDATVIAPKRRAKEAIRKITTVYPALKLDEIDGGIQLFPSRPAVRPKS
jgi:hypothetical protein